MIDGPVPGSFRDPSGFLFYRDEILYRQVNQEYQKSYDMLMSSGLYEDLAKAGLLIPHEEADVEPAARSHAYKILRPQCVEFISYPYEWCFSQLKDAALATLEIQRRAMDKGMSLKDASAYNIAFHQGHPVLIDTLSFEPLPQGRPWIAYRQFCQHFLAPLALAARRDIRLIQLLKIHIDGIPLDLASKLLGWSGRFSIGLQIHLHAHARSQLRHAGDTQISLKRIMSLRALMGLLDNLRTTVEKLDWRPAGTEWGEYYTFTNYTDKAFEHKRELVELMLSDLAPGVVWDLGANTGLFSRLASDKGIFTAAFDIDPAAVEKNYRQQRKERQRHILPLVMDLTNPTSAIGWAGQERMSLPQRGPADVVMALALIHHLAISNNVPLPRVAAYFSNLCRNLIIEFVPKSDSQVQRLLSTRQDVFPFYCREKFEEAFDLYFDIRQSHPVSQTERTLYVMSRKAKP